MPIKSHNTTSYLMAIVMFALSFSIYKTFAIDVTITLNSTLEWDKIKCKYAK